MNRTIRAWWPVVAWVALIGLATSVPLPGMGWARSDLPLDKIIHFTLYFGLGWFGGRALWRSERWSVGTLLVYFTAALALAGVDEWHQAWIPLREPSVADWLADASGLSLGLALYIWLRWRHHRRTL